MAVGFLLALSALISGCAGSAPPPAQSPPTTVALPGSAGDTLGSAAASDEPDPAAEHLLGGGAAGGAQLVGTPAPGGPLSRRGPPPGAVSRQVSFAGGGAGGGDCDLLNGVTSLPEGYFIGGGHQAPTELVACFFNFAPNQRIALALTLPDGTQERAALRAGPNGKAGWTRPVLHDDPLGEYKVTATQGERSASVAATVAPAPASLRITRIIPDGGPAGTVFQLALAGYEPNAALAFHVYQGHVEYYTYLTSIMAQTDERGAALIPLPTSAADTPGFYYLLPGDATSFGAASSFVVSTALAPERGAEAASLLSRRDTPPPGVAPLVASHTEACAPAPAPMISARTFNFTGDLIEVGEHIIICFSGFAPAQELQVTIGTEDGRTWPVAVPLGQYGTAQMTWFGTPDLPPGAYTIAAPQDGLTTLGGFRVAPASRPRLLALNRHTPAGRPLEFALAGFAPGAVVPLQIYKGTDHWGLVNEYVTSASTQVDDQGGGRFTLDTQPGDPPGQYVLVATDQQLPEAINLDGSTVDGFVPLARFAVAAAPVTVEPPTGPAGRDFRVALSGFAPFQPVLLQLIRRTGGGDEQLATFPVWTNDTGSAEFQLFTRADDPPGEYVVTASTPAEGAVFVVDPPELP